MAADILESYGYRVLLAADGAAGVEVFRKDPAAVAMAAGHGHARQGGRETYLQLKEVNRVRVLFSLQLQPEREGERDHRPGVQGFIQKPYQVRNSTKPSNT